MFPKSSRLKKNAAFQRVFSQGKPFFFQSVGCRCLSGREKTLVGFSVAKKMYPRAVDRNRAKRLLAVAARRHADAIPKGSHVIFSLARKRERLESAPIEQAVASIVKNMPY